VPLEVISNDKWRFIIPLEELLKTVLYEYRDDIVSVCLRYIALPLVVVELYIWGLGLNQSMFDLCILPGTSLADFIDSASRVMRATNDYENEVNYQELYLRRGQKTAMDLKSFYYRFGIKVL
jgi:hypothetical protein